MKRTGGHPLSSLLSLLSTVECFPTSISQCGGLRNRHTSAEEDGPGHCLALSGWGAADPISLTPLGCPASDFNTFFLVLVLLLGPLLATRPQPFIFRTWDCPGPLTRWCLRGQHGLALPGIANALPSFPHFWQCRAVCSASGAWPSFEGFLWGSVQAGSNLL